MTDDIIDELTWRGLIALSTDQDDLRRALAAGPVTFYGGFDPTAPGLHVGSLVLVVTARRSSWPVTARRAGRRGDRADRRPQGRAPSGC